MISLFFVVRRFFRAIRFGLRDPEFQAFGLGVITILIVGTIFYTVEEGWSVLDSLYFCVSTLTTIGFGDFAPTTALSKIFTIVYVFVGIGLLAGFITLVATYERRERREKSAGSDD